MQLIFTDLDGTLLDHHSYTFDAAREMLEYIKTKEIPLVLVTSKTRTEVLKLQKLLDIHAPFIVENGAGIFIPCDSPITATAPCCDEWIRLPLGKTYLEVRLFFSAMKKKYAIRGFGDLQVGDVMELTDLEEENARDAMARDFTEPFIASDESQIPALTQEANLAGLDIVKGGRFYHLMTLGQDKANAVDKLSQLYGSYYEQSIEVIALGDSMNDFTMLQRARHSVLIPHPDGSYAPISMPSLIKAPYPGPKGWNHALKRLLL